MVIDPRILARLMKAAYKDQGYRVAKVTEAGEDESTFYIETEDWAVEIEYKNVPGPILGLVAEHLKGLPNNGESFQVKRRESTTVLLDFVAGVPRKCAEEDDRVLCHRTPLTYNGLEVWQKDVNKECFLVDPELAAMLMDHGRIDHFIGGGVVLTGAASRVYICATTPANAMKDGPEKDALKYLSGEWWR